MATVNVKDLPPGTTAITWEGTVYTPDENGDITIEDEDFDPETVKAAGESAQAAADAHDRMATEAAPENETREAKDEAPAAGQSEREEEEAPRRGRPPVQRNS